MQINKTYHSWSLAFGITFWISASLCVKAEQALTNQKIVHLQIWLNFCVIISVLQKIFQKWKSQILQITAYNQAWLIKMFVKKTYQQLPKMPWVTSFGDAPSTNSCGSSTRSPGRFQTTSALRSVSKNKETLVGGNSGSTNSEPLRLHSRFKRAKS
jgi:uncharacterized membrane protein YbhN (UPF0104 family)